jgi:hypothetical protein
MFNSETPMESTVPLTVYSTTASPAIRIVNNRGGDSFNVEGGGINLGGSTVNIGGWQGGSQNVSLGGNVYNLSTQPSTITIGDSSSTTTIGGTTIRLGDSNTETITMNLGDIVLTLPDGSTQPLQEYIEENGGGGGGEEGSSRAVFLGKVLSGSGNSYLIQLYGRGATQAPTGQVTAYVPQIALGETIPAETWIACVHRVETVGGLAFYEFQPPVFV